jgi:DNA replication protein DnaC/primosomal protein DnaI
MLPTIYTSQYSLTELEAVLTRSGEVHTAEAICSRIAETCEAIHLQGVDLRRTKKI